MKRTLLFTGQNSALSTVKKLLLSAMLLLSALVSQAATRPVTPATFADVYNNAAVDGDILLLGAGNYTTAVAFPAGKAITLKADPGAATKPVLTFLLADPTGPGGSLTFDGVVIDGAGADYFYTTSAALSTNTWKFVNCTIKNITKSLYNSTNKAENISNITFDKCVITASGTTKTSFLLVSQTVDVFNVTNTTVYNYVGGDFFHPNNATSTKNIAVTFTNNTMYKSIYDKGYGWVSINNVYAAGNTYLFQNNIFDNGSNPDPVANQPLLVYKGNGTVTEQNNIKINYQANNGTTTNATNLTLGTAPLTGYTSVPYTNAAAGDFTLPSGSPFASAGFNGALLGDPRWLGSTLPITGLTLKAERKQDAVLLSFTTLSEINASHFDVEKSTNGTSFNKIGLVKANGNTQSVSSYSFVDNTPATGINYYRLLQVDKDGASKYSEVVSAEIAGSNANLSVYPNPAQGQFVTVNHEAAVGAKIHLLSLDGKKLATKNVADITTNTKVDISTLLPGVYFLQYSNGNTTLTSKFIKQ